MEDQNLEATVHPVERAGDHVALTIDYSIPRSSRSDTQLNMDRLMNVGPTLAPGTSNVRLVDLPGGRVWTPGVVKGQKSTPTVEDWVSATTQDSLGGYSLTLRGAGKTTTTVTFFGNVDASSVDVLIPLMGLVTDVPVVDGGPNMLDLASLGIDKGASVTYAPPFSLGSLVQAYDGGASSKKQGSQQTVVMASDVLFATDVATLSDAAAARVDEVAGQINKVASGGTVAVVGHTDDVGTDEYNLDLSRRRAASVAERMRATLGSSFTVTEDGKGKSEPAVDGTDAAARAANRRVEISFTAADSVDLSGQTATVPPASGPVASGHDPVTYTVSGKTFTAQVLAVVRRDGYLVGTLTVTQTSAGYSNAYIVCDEKNHSGEREAPAALTEARSVTLMGPEGRVFPAQYWSTEGLVPTDVPIVLADRYLNFNLEKGYSFTYTVVWPDTGESKVTIDSPDRFRITDVPVEKK